MKTAGVQEALAKVDSMQPDLIFTDMRLADGNGLDFTRSIRAAGIESVIIVLTSHDLPEYREAAITHGADRFMSKGSNNIGDIFSVAESILASCLRVLIAAEDATFREQTDAFLSRGWPRSLVACARDGKSCSRLRQR